MLYEEGRGLHYAEVFAAAGALAVAERIGDAESSAALADRYRAFLDGEESTFISRLPHVDRSVTGVLPLQLYYATKDVRYLHLGLSFADRQWWEPRPDGLTRETRWWVDDMYMVARLQLAACEATGNPVYADRAALQVDTYLKKLQQPNGLFHHAPGHPFYWGRGNGWVAAAMTEVLRVLPGEHPRHATMLECYRTMMATLLAYQAPGGMWRQLLDDEHAWGESSCTAMFAFSMATGLQHGWLDRAIYGSAVERAWQALASRVDERGRVSDVCAGMNVSDEASVYLSQPHAVGDLHGQAALLWLVLPLLV